MVGAGWRQQLGVFVAVAAVTEHQISGQQEQRQEADGTRTVVAARFQRAG
jgi:hypothetical protein